MKEQFRQLIATILVPLLAALPCLPAAAQSSQADSTTKQLPLRDYLRMSYEELFKLAPTLNFTTMEIEQERQALKRAKNSCTDRFKDHSKAYDRQLDTSRKALKSGGPTLGDAPRKELHCKIQNLELLNSEAKLLQSHAIPTAYDNLDAKLDLMENWPSEYNKAKAEMASGAYHQRRWADVKDIGFREIAAGQRDDIKRGRDAVEELKRSGLMPPELENKEIQQYVQSVGERVARHSDLKVPLHITVLQSREINAFALPGGYIFIERGLLEAVDDESQLAGVIAHEIAHDTARHSAKLMKRATIAGIFYQAAQLAAVLLTGGVAGIGLYYALQYGFYGLGMVLSLKLLGVSRDYELEADQLGVQYAWNAGYDTSGFMRFFDKMANRVGYVNGVSWFRTHPPFYERMVQAQREIMFMPDKPGAVVQTSEFLAMKKALVPVAAAAEKEEVGKPSLLMTKEEGCAPPEKLEYEPGQPIEQLCSSPLRSVEGGATTTTGPSADAPAGDGQSLLARPLISPPTCGLATLSGLGTIAAVSP
ncbi:MAG TPA: M48 family metalloprotease [Terracidiphilus sp.]|nr:M48 family metalloprotease [Terracidiphilus sp.]